MIKKEDTYYCDFCGKSQHEVAKVVAGPDSIGICDECVTLAAGICDDGHPKPDAWHKAQADLVRDAARYQFIRADVQRMAAEGVYLGPQTAEQMDAAVDERMAKEKTNGL